MSKRPPSSRLRLEADDLLRARQNPFSDLVLGDCFIVCLECGRRMRALGKHLDLHGLDAAEYREKWGYKESQGLIAQDLSEHKSTVSRELDLQRFGRISPGGIPTGETSRKSASSRSAQVREAMSSSRKGRPKAPRTTSKNRLDVTVEVIQALLEQGLSTQEVALRLECSTALVGIRLREAGQRRKPVVTTPLEDFVRAHDEGLTVAAIAQRFGCNSETVRERLTRAGKIQPRARAPQERILKLAAQQLSRSQIAEQLALPLHVVAFQLKKWTRTAAGPEQLAWARENPHSDQVIGDRWVLCLECGQTYASLVTHLPRHHQMSREAYREKWGYALGESLDRRRNPE